MIRVALFILITIAFAGCKTNRYNAEGKRHGRWIVTDTLEKIYTYKGRYRNGIEVGKWKYYWDKKLSRLDKHKGKTATIKLFFPDGKLKGTGKAGMDISATEIHWYYFGEWQNYNEQGKLIAIRTYEKGQLIKETEF